MFEAGTMVAGWRVERELDDGPTTITYKVLGAHDGSMAHGVMRVLKMQDPTFGDRLRRNAEALKDNHDHLVDVLAVVEHEGAIGVVSKYIDGPDLAEWAAAGQPLGASLALFSDIIAGLDEAHRAGLVHRNLKPAKVRVSATHHAFLEDFLLSKVMTNTDHNVTGIGVTFGTPQYMSPEQFHGAAHVESRGDLFSAGCVLYELVTRRRAFDGGSIKDVYLAIIDGQYADPRTVADVPEPVAALIDDLLQPATEDRPESAAAVLERLRTEPLASLIVRPDPGEDTGLPATRRAQSIPPSQVVTLMDDGPGPGAPPAHPTLIADDAADYDSVEAPVAPIPPRRNTMLWMAAAMGLSAGLGGFIIVAVLISLWAGS